MSEPTVDHAAVAALYVKIGAVESDISEIKDAIKVLSTARNTSWPTIFGGLTVAVSILVAFGSVILGPMQRDTSRLEATVVSLIDKGVFQREYTQDINRINNNFTQYRGEINEKVGIARYMSDQNRLQESLKRDQDGLEFLRVRSYDAYGRISKLEQSEVDLNKRLDTISARVIAIANSLKQIP